MAYNPNSNLNPDFSELRANIQNYGARRPRTEMSNNVGIKKNINSKMILELFDANYMQNPDLAYETFSNILSEPRYVSIIEKIKINKQYSDFINPKNKDRMRIRLTLFKEMISVIGENAGPLIHTFLEELYNILFNFTAHNMNGGRRHYSKSRKIKKSKKPKTVKKIKYTKYTKYTY